MRQTRYTIQVVKCLDEDCCVPFQTNWLSVFPDRFPPYPAVHKYGIAGVEAVEPQEYFRNPKLAFSSLSQRALTKVQPIAAKSFIDVPFDIYCPSMEKKLDKGICPICASYWPSQAAMNRHRKCHLANSDEVNEADSSTDEMSDYSDIDEVDEGSLLDVPEEMPVYENIFEKMQGPFIDI